MAYGGRAQYGLGSIVKSVKKAVKGVTKGVKDFAKSDLGKAALLIGGGMYAGGLGHDQLGERHMTDYLNLLYQKKKIK